MLLSAWRRLDKSGALAGGGCNPILSAINPGRYGVRASILLVPSRRRRGSLCSRGMAHAVGGGCECRVCDRCGVSRHHRRSTAAWNEESVVRLDRVHPVDLELSLLLTTPSHNFIAS